MRQLESVGLASDSCSRPNQMRAGTTLAEMLTKVTLRHSPTQHGSRTLVSMLESCVDGVLESAWRQPTLAPSRWRLCGTWRQCETRRPVYPGIWKQSGDQILQARGLSGRLAVATMTMKRMVSVRLTGHASVEDQGTGLPDISCHISGHLRQKI